LALTGTLSISGPRPGEIYALDWSTVYLDASGEAGPPGSPPKGGA
jgi:hypothetical protein